MAFRDLVSLSMFPQRRSSPQKKDVALPRWLAQQPEMFKAALTSGNAITLVILGVLERELQLASGALTSLHQSQDPPSVFWRVLRYIGEIEGQKIVPQGSPAHKDTLSVAILFTCLGGLQIPKPDATIPTSNVVAEDDWLWVEPLPGYAIVNLGDAMEIFTNGALKSGLHRVVRAPGPQAAFDKYSVLLGTRPHLEALMKPFKSPMIPEETEEQGNAKVLTSEQWGTSKIKGLQDASAKEQRVATDGK